jgi:hypothetical protein
MLRFKKKKEKLFKKPFTKFFLLPIRLVLLYKRNGRGIVSNASALKLNMGWGVASVVEHQPSRHKALSSNSSTAPKKKLITKKSSIQ